MRNCLQCDHVDDENEGIAEYETVNSASPSFVFLIEDLCNNLRLEQLHRTANLSSTFLLESYHSVVISYRPKRYYL